MCTAGQELSVQLTIHTWQIVLGKLKQLVLNQNSYLSGRNLACSLLYHTPKKHPFCNSKSVWSYYSNIPKEKHCDPGKFVSHFIQHLWSCHTAPSFGDTFFPAASIAPHETPRVPTLFLCCIHCQPPFLFRLGIIAIFSSLSFSKLYST